MNLKTIFLLFEKVTCAHMLNVKSPYELKVAENFVYYLLTFVKIWSVRIVFSPRFWDFNQIINGKHTVQISPKHVGSC